MTPAEYFRQLPMIRTSRLILRKLTMDDAADVFAYASNPIVTRFTTWDTHRSVEDSRAFISFALQRYEAGHAVGYGIVDAATNHVIGTCGIAGWSDQHERGDLAYAIAAPYWNKGYMTEAARAAVDHAFAALPMNRLQSCCHVDNIGSARVMEKLGMTFEGVLRQYFKIRNGYHDLRYYSLLRSEWERSQATAILSR